VGNEGESVDEVGTRLHVAPDPDDVASAQRLPRPPGRSSDLDATVPADVQG